MMVNHPNRTKNAVGTKYVSVRANPTPKDIIAAREGCGLTQQACADLIYSTLRSWQDWEAGQRRMHPGLFELFNIKIAMQRAAVKTVANGGK